ncbi:MAG TPA: ATP-dependent protease ATPase subunit HslU [Ignavibacteria bacterium]|nr:ATP-dependent protease ATPase subunit HslU [Ignavibacteria bacterium]
MEDKSEDNLVISSGKSSEEPKLPAKPVNGKSEPKKPRLKKEAKTEVNPLSKELTPSQIVAELDKYIIGQDNAKKSVAIALRNRWRRKKIEESIREEIMPNNIILIGPTGVGKTEIARRLAKLSNAAFIKVEASKFTEVGYVGRDVESIIRELTDLGVTMVKSERSIEVQKKAEYLAEERILDILLPPVKKKADDGAASAATLGFSAAQPETDKEENFKTREKFREMLHKGELDERIIEVDVSGDGMPMMQVMGPIGLDDIGVNLQDLFSSVMPKKVKKRKMTVKEARVILVQEEAHKLIDMDSVIKEAIERVQEYGIVFIDEIDKIAGKQSKSQGPDVSREGVQRDMLPIVEGSSVTTKYGMVKTDHILFIASGAFHVSKPSDLIPELQGRFPIRVELNSLTEDDFVKILTQPQNALLKQYEALLKAEEIDLSFDDDGILEIARIAAEVNEQVENIGARRLHTILSTLLEDILYNTPDRIKEKKIVIDRKMVDEKLKDIVKNRDLSRYIL